MVSERQEAFRDLCLAAQTNVTFPSTTTDRLVVYRDVKSGLLVCGGRVQYFKKDGKAVPLLPFDAWIATLLAREAHSEGHDGVVGTLLRMRQKAWVIRGRKIAQKVVDKCIVCKKARAKICQQVMGDLPDERTRPAAPFEFTAVDLFGPYQVRDDIKKSFHESLGSGVLLHVKQGHSRRAGKHTIDGKLLICLPEVYRTPWTSIKDLVRSWYQLCGGKTCSGGAVCFPEGAKQRNPGRVCC